METGEKLVLGTKTSNFPELLSLHMNHECRKRRSVPSRKRAEFTKLNSIP